MEVVLTLWLIFGIVAFVFGAVVFGCSYDEVLVDHPLRARKLAYALMLSGLLLPVAAPIWAFFGARLLIRQIRADVAEIQSTNSTKQLKDAHARIAELERELRMGEFR